MGLVYRSLWAQGVQGREVAGSHRRPMFRRIVALSQGLVHLWQQEATGLHLVHPDLEAVKVASPRRPLAILALKVELVQLDKEKASFPMRLM